MLRIGAWSVNPAAGQISRAGEIVRVEARTMRLLLCLAGRAGQIVSIDELLDQAWPGVVVTPDSVYQAVATLRRLLGDDPKQPVYIATVPRLGYRMVATVSPWTDEPPAAADSSRTAQDAPPMLPANEEPPAAALEAVPIPRRKAFIALAVGLALCLTLIVALLPRANVADKVDATSPPIAVLTRQSIAVLPFLDLTEEMDHEPFADGMTEELIGKLSKIPGLQVPAPTSSFYFKGRQATVADIAKALGVTYVLDGSVRKSGATLRVAARLIRADSGFVVWSETYDRSWDDFLMVQDDIAGEVAEAVGARGVIR